nr:hypothetical protein BaRGS_026113 [Batillaria attramentaria]
MRVYRRATKRLGVVPLRKVMAQFGQERLCFRNLTLTSRDMKATCMALLRDSNGVELDFSGNYIGGRECDYLVSVLANSDNFHTLDVSNNCLRSRGIRQLAAFVSDTTTLTVLNLSGNKLTDADAQAVAGFLTANSSLRTLSMNHNEFREKGGRLIGSALGKNRHLEELELRWNHLRRDGAIGIAKGLEENKSLHRVDLSWNGFGFEGCMALSDTLARNHTIEELDISSNRINPPGVMELVKGLAKNKALRILKIGQNPITASFSSVLLNTIRKHPTVALQHLDMEGIVVDRDFQGILDDINQTRRLHVKYDIILPVKSMSREDMLRRIQTPGAYNLDPLHMFFMLKEKMRASDFFYKINKDNDDSVSPQELHQLFTEAGIPVTRSVIDKIVEFMDTDGDGSIDIGEFMSGDRKMKRMTRNHVKNTMDRKKQKADDYMKYSRSFKKAQIDPVTLSLKVTEADPRLSPVPDRTEAESVDFASYSLSTVE